MENVYIDYVGIKRMFEELTECAEIVKDENSKLLQYLDMLKNYWVGSAEAIFSGNMEEYSDFFARTVDDIKNYTRNLISCESAYENFESEFSKIDI